MNTLEYIKDKFKLDLKHSPVEIPNFGRDNMAELFAELGFKMGAEIGVCDGAYSEILCKANPNAHIYGVDPFVPYKEYRDYVNRKTIDTYHQKAIDRLKQYPNYKLIEKFSMEALFDFADNSLDFVYIDANHDFVHVAEDLTYWYKKVKPGGIISGHDYYRHKGPTLIHVYEAVNGFTQAHHIKPWFILGTNAMIPGEIRDKNRSFAWVKP